jgi:hypothetical protein
LATYINYNSYENKDVKSDFEERNYSDKTLFKLIDFQFC